MFIGQRVFQDSVFRGGLAGSWCAGSGCIMCAALSRRRGWRNGSGCETSLWWFQLIQLLKGVYWSREGRRPDWCLLSFHPVPLTFSAICSLYYWLFSSFFTSWSVPPTSVLPYWSVVCGYSSTQHTETHFNNQTLISLFDSTHVLRVDLPFIEGFSDWHSDPGWTCEFSLIIWLTDCCPASHKDEMKNLTCHRVY